MSGWEGSRRPPLVSHEIARPGWGGNVEAGGRSGGSGVGDGSGRRRAGLLRCQGQIPLYFGSGSRTTTATRSRSGG